MYTFALIFTFISMYFSFKIEMYKWFPENSTWTHTIDFKLSPTAVRGPTSPYSQVPRAVWNQNKEQTVCVALAGAGAEA